MGHAVILWLAGAGAWAQPVAEPEVPDLNAQLFRAAVDSEHTLWTDTSGHQVGHTLERSEVHGRMVLHYVNRPLVFVPGGRDQVTALVSDVLQLDLTGSWSFDRLRAAVVAPVYLFNAGALTDDGAGFGDLGFDVRATALDRAVAPAGLAAFGRVILPTASVDAPLGNPGVAGEVGVIADAEPAPGLVLATNLGARLAPRTRLDNIVTDDAFTWRLGGGYGVHDDDAGISADLAGAMALGTDVSNRAATPIELMVGGWGRLSRQLTLRGGVGRGLTPGIGSSNARLVAMLAYEPPGLRGFRTVDRDNDGLVDLADKCPDEPEDLDGHLDDDGCPDDDRDGDGVNDLVDVCVSEPEDIDGYRDSDGCPDPGVEVPIRVQDPWGREIPHLRAIIRGPQHPVKGDRRDFTAPLHEGAYSITATAPGFVNGALDFNVPVERDGPVLLVLWPQAPMSSLAVTVLDDRGQPVTDAVWELDGGEMPPLVDGAINIDMTVGQHELYVRAPGFVAKRVTVDVPLDELHHEVVRLERPGR